MEFKLQKKFFNIPEKNHWYIKRVDLRNGRKSRLINGKIKIE